MGIARMIGALVALFRPNHKKHTKPTKRTIELLMPASTKASKARSKRHRKRVWHMQHPLATLMQRHGEECSARRRAKRPERAWASWRKREQRAIRLACVEVVGRIAQ